MFNEEEKFDKIKFSIIIKEISNAYENTTEFSKKADVNRTYISKIINKKLNNPPSPGILKKIADNSKGITSYDELMEVCGYFTGRVKNSLVNSCHYIPIPIFSSLEEIIEYDELKNSIDEHELREAFHYIYFKTKVTSEDSDFFAYKISISDMTPLLDIDDFAIIFKCQHFENGKTYLVGYDGDILIRKIIDNGDNKITLQAMNPYYPIINTTKDKIEIIGKVLEAHNSSAFK